MRFDSSAPLEPIRSLLQTAFVIIVSAWIISSVTATFAWASAVENDAAALSSLQGLKGVYVAVREMNPEIEKKGLTTEMVRTDAHMSLKKAGINILSRQEWTQTEGGPVCYIEVSIVSDAFLTGILESELYAYGISVEFNQDVVLLRDPAVQALSPTWSSSYLGITNSLPRVREKAKEMINRFVTAYCVANPGTPFAEKFDLKETTSNDAAPSPSR